MITVIKSGLLTTVQDLGRPGYQQFGIVVGGALDAFAARTVNTIVGNDENAALIEIAQTGPDLLFTHDALVAWTGGHFYPRVGSEILPKDRAVRIAAGEVVSFGFTKSGLRAWIAVAGGIDVPLVLGSRSTYRRAGIGGHKGRPLVSDDKLKLNALPERGAKVLAALRSAGRRATTWSVRPDTMGEAAPLGTLRAMRGPEWEWFSTEAKKVFFETEWEATREGDRMGLRLDGPPLPLAKPREMISSAVNSGVVQVPAAGSLIVLLPSRQSIGGYPRIAAVAAVDLRACAQLKPGDKIRFEEITLAKAHALSLARERDFARVCMGLARIND
ncbi:biotin-dependent carboxyltransferase family protein [Oleiharenicola lentus]|uniref:5-oxoprolinase subunit C family protein n=1 Tax=Oleiharenicola lentus TaxID=2508720 RepID=UPI003F6749F3